VGGRPSLSATEGDTFQGGNLADWRMARSRFEIEVRSGLNVQLVAEGGLKKLKKADGDWLLWHLVLRLDMDPISMMALVVSEGAGSFLHRAVTKPTIMVGGGGGGEQSEQQDTSEKCLT
jgi:hypothetical protein